MKKSKTIPKPENIIQETTEKPERKKTGRKPIELDLDQAEIFGKFFATQRTMAEWFGCSHDTIQRMMHNPNHPFCVAYQNGLANTKLRLAEAQLQTALNGNATIQVWMGKQLLEQTDRPQQSNDMQRLPRDIRREIYAKRWDITTLLNLMYIKTKDQTCEPIQLNTTQKRFSELIHTLEAKKIPLRIVILKARQEGMSTFVADMFYNKTAFGENTNTLVVADLAAHSTNLFNMYKMFHEYLPEEDRTETKANNAKVLDFSENNSRITIGTADNTDTANSSTIHNFHGSEVGLWRNSDELMLGVMQAVPDLPNTCVILESTARGEGNYFHGIVKGAEYDSNGERAKYGEPGKNGWVLFFAPWFEHSEYRKQLPEGYELVPEESGAYGNEKWYADTYKLDAEQLYWRRWTITNKCNGNVKYFCQEYPANVDEAFLTSGYPVFDLMILNDLEQQAVSLPSYYANIENMAVNIHETSSTSGHLKIWRKPYTEASDWDQVTRWRNRYVIFADTGGTWEGADYSCADVYDRVSRSVVAQLHGHFDSYEYAEMLIGLGRYYDNCLLCVESNRWDSETDRTGETVIDHIQKFGYANLYLREVYDDVAKVMTTRVGFHTNASTKQMIVDSLRRFVNLWDSEHVMVNDIETIHEMRTYIVDMTETGKTTWNASKGKKDDRVITFGGCLVVSAGMPSPVEWKDVRRKTAKQNARLF